MGIAEKHAKDRIVSVLDGGYDLEGLARSAAAHVESLMGAQQVLTGRVGSWWPSVTTLRLLPPPCSGRPSARGGGAMRRYNYLDNTP